MIYPSLFVFSTLFSASVVVVDAQNTVGNEGFTVPPFACFGPTPTMKFDMTASVSDLSGVTFHPGTQTFFTVNNGDRMIYEIAFPNTLIQSWNVTGLTLDLEGITVLPPSSSSSFNTTEDDPSVKGHFAITDENPASVITVTLHEDGTYSNATTIFAGLPEPAASNLGFEGLAYLTTDPPSYVIAQEATPAKLWQLSATGTDQGDDIQDLTGDLIDGADFQIRSIGGITRGGDAIDEVFVVVKTYTGMGRGNETYFQKGILRYDLTTGQFTERFGGEVCSMGQPEGLTFWKNGTTISMLVVGETFEALLYEADESCTADMGSISFEMATCPKQEVTVAACEKTLEDGGCGWLRCDKDQTFHTKICTDDEPGVTDCTREQCFQFCNTSSFAAVTDAAVAVGRQVNGTGEMQEVCTHWSYDEAEKECYIFGGCNNAKFDEDYTLYAMQDTTCERTFEDFPNGCEQRRCDKDQSTHNKICTDDNPGVTDCSFEECKAKCEAHTEFKCTTYAYDQAEKECYLFQECVNESFDEDYSLYVLIDPTCDKNQEDGGCNQRRCDKDITPHEKICVDDTPEQQCSIEECELHCAEKTFTDVGSEAFCTHWAFDEVDQECYLFYGCIGEKYDDDYVLFTQSYGERMSLLLDGPIGTDEEVVESTAASKALLSGAAIVCALLGLLL